MAVDKPKYCTEPIKSHSKNLQRMLSAGNRTGSQITSCLTLFLINWLNKKIGEYFVHYEQSLFLLSSLSVKQSKALVEKCPWEICGTDVHLSLRFPQDIFPPPLFFRFMVDGLRKKRDCSYSIYFVIG